MINLCRVLRDRKTSTHLKGIALDVVESYGARHNLEVPSQAHLHLLQPRSDLEIRLRAVGLVQNRYGSGCETGKEVWVLSSLNRSGPST